MNCSVMSAILFNDIIALSWGNFLDIISCLGTRCHFIHRSDVKYLATVLSVLSWSFLVLSSGYLTFFPFMVLSCPFIWLPYFLSFHGPFLSFHLVTLLSPLSWSFPVLSSGYRTFCSFMVLSCTFIWLPNFLSFHGPFLFIHLAIVLSVLSWSFLVLSSSYHVVSFYLATIPSVLSLSFPDHVISFHLNTLCTFIVLTMSCPFYVLSCRWLFPLILFCVMSFYCTEPFIKLSFYYFVFWLNNVVLLIKQCCPVD